MINNTDSKKVYKVQLGVTEYPIGFPFQSNPDGTPQLAVTIGVTYLQLNYNCKLSEDNGTLILIPTEEEAETLAGPEDYSWMDKWVDAPLVITRDIPFVQESDYQVGRISPEQIEKDFDLSVMRDQILLDKIGEHTTDVSEELESLHSYIDFVQQTHENDVVEIDAGITRNAVAIQKTRDDMNAEDSRLQTQITAQDAAITTNKNDITKLGNDVAGIQAKIPESASGNNHLITKQQLLAAETDIRDDMNQSDNKLQAQINAQAAKIAGKQDKLNAGDNIIISGNVISATGGGAGLDFIVVEELPETGQKGVVYLIAKDGEAPDVYDEYVWITATETFELIGSTKVDLSDYATKEDLENIDALPDQMGNAGKFLTTDGTAASWSDKPLVNKASDPSSVEDSSVIIYGIPNKRWCSTVVGAEASNANGYGTVVGYKASGGPDTVAIGMKANADSGIAIGKEASSKSTWSIAIGDKASANKASSIALGENAKTEEEHTFVVGLGWDGNNSRYANYKLLNFDGTIPTDRMSATAGTTGQVLTKTDAGMEWQDPSGGTTITLKEYDE